MLCSLTSQNLNSGSGCSLPQCGGCPGEPGITPGSNPPLRHRNSSLQGNSGAPAPHEDGKGPPSPSGNAAGLGRELDPSPAEGSCSRGGPREAQLSPSGAHRRCRGCPGPARGAGAGTARRERRDPAAAPGRPLLTGTGGVGRAGSDRWLHSSVVRALVL